MVPEVLVWDAKSEKVLQKISWQNRSMWATSLAFSQDGRMLAISSQTDADVNVAGSEKVKGELQIIALER